MTKITSKELYQEAKKNPALQKELDEVNCWFDQSFHDLCAKMGYQLESNEPISDDEAGEVSGGRPNVKFRSEKPLL